jgi:GDP-L-fucose synthase
VAKIAGIELCRSLNREHGTDYLSLMPTNLYGPGDNFNLETSHLVPALIRKFHDGKTAGAPVVLWGTGTPRRELMHVDDLASAICLFLESAHQAKVPSGLINVGTGKDSTIAQLAGLVQRVVGYEGEVKWDASKPDGTPQRLLDVSLARSLGWEAQIGIEHGLRQTYEWYVQTRS